MNVRHVKFWEVFLGRKCARHIREIKAYMHNESILHDLKVLNLCLSFPVLFSGKRLSLPLMPLAGIRSLNMRSLVELRDSVIISAVRPCTLLDSLWLNRLSELSWRWLHCYAGNMLAVRSLDRR